MSFFDRSFGSMIGPLKNGSKNDASADKLIEKGFAPQNNKIDILLINPPSLISERYGKENIGEVGGDLIPLGMASLAAYLISTIIPDLLAKKLRVSHLLLIYSSFQVEIFQVHLYVPNTVI